MALTLEKNKYYRRARIPFGGDSYADMRTFVMNDLNFLIKQCWSSKGQVKPECSHPITSTNEAGYDTSGLSNELCGLNGLWADNRFSYVNKASAAATVAEDPTKYMGFGFKISHENCRDRAVYKDWTALTSIDNKPGVSYVFEIDGTQYPFDVRSGLANWNAVTSIWYGLIGVTGGGFWSGVDTNDNGQYPSSQGQTGLWFCQMKWDADDKEYPAIVYKSGAGIKVMIFNPEDPALNNSLITVDETQSPGAQTQSILAPIGIACAFQVPTLGYKSTNLFVKETNSEAMYGMFSFSGQKFFGSDYFCLLCEEGT